MSKIRLEDVKQDLIQVPQGFPALSNISPIRIDCYRYRGSLCEMNRFAVLTREIDGRPQDRWHIEPENTQNSTEELMADLLRRFPSSIIWATGRMDMTVIDFDFVADDISKDCLKEFVIRSFEPIQMEEYWRYERASILLKGFPLVDGGITVTALLAFHGLHVNRRH